MAKTQRVFQIAKELGVASKAVVEKCQAEGVPGIENHMSTVKVGLAQTIREWFSEDHQVQTAVESTDQVDLGKAKKARRRRAKAARADEADKSGDDSSVAVMDEPAKAGKAAKSTQAPEEAASPAPEEETPAPEEAQETPQESEDQSAAATETEKPAESETPAPEATADEAEAETQAKQPEPTTPMGVPNVPKKPTVVKPAGDRVKPTAAKLRGPKVVRVEKADELPKPRRAGGGGGGRGPARGGRGGGGPAEMEPQPEVTRSRGPARGRGAGAPRDDEGPEKGGPGKRRSLSSRRGRSGNALPTGPTKFTEADLAELDAKLNRASGYVKRRRQDQRRREASANQAQTPAEVGGKVEVQEPLFIKDLSAATGIKAADIIKYLFKKGIMATINSAIGVEAAMEVCLEYDIELEVKEQQSAAQKIEQDFSEREIVDSRPRPPIVTVLGHVDHGKTSLLDRIRAADVAAHEAGGITQHIGAYRVTIQGHDENEKTVVFLDTPGHEAFTTMRARGASMTDIVVLVVAADDGVMPQTIESINHAKAAGVPIVVALNKIDTPQATDENIHKIYGQLAEHGLNPVEWGGETEIVKTSAIKGTGVTELLEILDYQAELLELTADYGGAARGLVIEAEMQEGRGPVARVLVQDGQIKIGDFIVIGRAFGRVRDMTDDRNRRILEAGPATPIELSGIDRVPDAGDKFYITDSLQRAEQISEHFREIEREQQLATKTKVTLENFAQTVAAADVKELRVVLKADVQGSLDVLQKTLGEIGNNEVTVRVLHSAVGGITEGDIVLADASDAVVIGFHVTATPAVREIAENRHVDIRLYRVIYDVTNDIKAALEGMLTPDKKEEQLGQAEVREVFRVSKLGNVAGCLVTEGVMQKTSKIRVERDGVVVTDNRNIGSLRRVKDDVAQVRIGTECGIRIDGFDDVKPGDILTCYSVIEVKRKLE